MASTNEQIRNEKGQVIGYKNTDGTYYKTTGEVVARVRGGNTYDGKSQLKGKGDQGLRLF